MADTACTEIVPFAAVGLAAQWQALADERMQARRTITFPASSAIGSVFMKQIPGKALGAYAWAAGVELACFVERRYADRLRGLRILELGSGTGITGIALAKLGACVVCTDMFPDLVVLMRKNISAAGLDSSSCRALPFEWGHPLPGPLQGSFDLVIGSEITYNEAGFGPLAESLRALCGAAAATAEQAPGQQQAQAAPAVIIAETLRNSMQPECWALLGRDFISREVFASPQHDSWNVRDAAAPVRIFELQWRRIAPAAPSLEPTLAPAVCPRVASVAEATAALEQHGACIFMGRGVESADAAAVPREVFGERLRAAPEPTEVSNRVLVGQGNSKEDSLQAYTDRHAYGDLFPDFFVLLCARARHHGGEHVLVDGYAVLDALAADLEAAWVPSALEARPVDHTSHGASVTTPVVLRAPCGRRVLRCPPEASTTQRAAAGSDHHEADAAMLATFHAAVEQATAAAPRLELRPGEALLVDNYRMLHGCGTWSDEDHLFWRCRVWTSMSRGVPEGEPHSSPGEATDVVAQS